MQRNKENPNNKKVITDNQKDKSIFSKVYILFIIFFLFCLVQVFIWWSHTHYEYIKTSNTSNNDIKNVKKSDLILSPFRDKSISSPVMMFDMKESLKLYNNNNNNQLIIDKPKEEFNNILKIPNFGKVKNDVRAIDISVSKLESKNIINNNNNNNNKVFFSNVVIDKSINKIKISNINKYNNIGKSDVVMPENVDMTWNDFTNIPLKSHTDIYSNNDMKPLSSNFKPNICSKAIINNLNEPLLSIENKTFCSWAFKKGVIVGKSWGTLENIHKIKFDELNCNSFSKGHNPSCNDKWGDNHIYKWKKNQVLNIKCDSDRKSKMNCFENENIDRFCIVEKMQINFKLMKNIPKGKYEDRLKTDTKQFQQGFLSSDCKAHADNDIKTLKFSHLYNPFVYSQKCDYVINGTTVIFSHDDIRNAGHFMQDMMNVWVMLWLSGMSRYTKDITFMNIDSFLLGHNFHDKPNGFFSSYYQNFQTILQGETFGDKTVCLQRVLMQPLPPTFFVRDGWNKDQPCSFLGPSSIYQRFNMHIRHSYGLLNENSITSNSLQIMFVLRKETENLWGHMRSSRMISNEYEVLKGLQDMSVEIQKLNNIKINFLPVDLSNLTVTEQIKLFGDTSIIMGMHGAGIAMGNMHLPIGTKYCCGVFEIYPAGEFVPIRGHGNMAREMGHHYDRIDLEVSECSPDGAKIQIRPLVTKVRSMIMKLIDIPTCILPEVVDDPYFESDF